MEAALAAANIDAAHPFSEPPRAEGAKRFTIGVEIRIESRRNKKSGKYLILDGRLCLSCGCKDCDPDWAVPDEPMMWGRPLRPNGHNTAEGCWYCVRVHEARYEAKGWKFTAWQKEIGMNAEFQSRFMLYWKLCTAKFQQVGTRAIRVKWGEIEEQVERIRKKQVEVSWEPDVYEPFAEYVKDHGDPQFNGKGHSTIDDWYGEKVVKIPGKKRWMVQRKEIHEIQKRSVLDKSDFVLGENQLNDNFAAFADDLFSAFPTATGEVIAPIASTPDQQNSSSSNGTGQQAQQKSSSSQGGQNVPEARPSEDDDDCPERDLFGWRGATCVPVRKDPVKSEQATPVSKAAKRPPLSTPPGAKQPKKANDANRSQEGRGRKARPVMTVVSEDITAFEQCEDNKHYFEKPNSWRETMKRNLQKLKAAMDAEEGSELKIEKNAESIEKQKQLTVAVDVSAQWVRSKNSWDQAMISQYKASSLFLQLPPASRNPCPNWMKQRYLIVSVEEDMDPEDFWNLLTRKSLTDCGWLPEKLQEQFHRFLVTKVVGVAKDVEQDRTATFRLLMNCCPKEIAEDHTNTLHQLQALGHISLPADVLV